MTMVATRNLMTYRSSDSVWDRRGAQRELIEERLTRLAVSISGAGLIVYGALRRSWRGAPYVAAGVALMTRAASEGRSADDIRVLWRRQRQAAESDQPMTEIIDSFPASDAPSSNATIVAAGTL